MDEKLTAERVQWHRDQCAYAVSHAEFDHERQHYTEWVAICDLALQSLRQPEAREGVPSSPPNDRVASQSEQ